MGVCSDVSFVGLLWFEGLSPVEEVGLVSCIVCSRKPN